jgi:putative membrane protein
MSSAEKTAAESSRRVAKAVEQVEGSADRRTVLAADRTIFAAERTYAAWVRTGLASLAAGVGAKAALGGIIPATIVVTSGCVLVLFSIFCFAAAVWRELIPGVPPPTPDVYRLPTALLVIINGFLVAISVAAFAAICLGLTPVR